MPGEVPRKKKREANCGNQEQPVQDVNGNNIDGDGNKLELQRCEDDINQEE